MSKMKPGKEYELLFNKCIVVQSPMLRLHMMIIFMLKELKLDVSIKYKFAGIDHLIISQAKDYNNVSLVDQFQKVIEDVYAKKGILICSKEFSKAAIIKLKVTG